MSGGGAGPIILKVVKDSLSVGVNKSGSVKLWHIIVLSHLVNGIGWLV